MVAANKSSPRRNITKHFPLYARRSPRHGVTFSKMADATKVVFHVRSAFLCGFLSV